jgi:Cys-tRNA(Pro)/Cys-tRNA(Cys) deacylase
VPPTPAIQVLDLTRTSYSLHEYHHDSRTRSFGSEAASALEVEAPRVFKTLVVRADQALAVAVVPVSAELDTKAFARSLGAKRAVMADPAAAERSTGYVLGGISPLGQKRQLLTVIDRSATTFPTIFVSGGRRGLEIELAADDLAALLRAAFADIATTREP